MWRLRLLTGGLLRTGADATGTVADGKNTSDGLSGVFCINTMEMSNLETLLAILTALSGIGNLAQWSNIKALRAKSRYEAEGVHVEVLNRTITMQAEEIRRLQERVHQLEVRDAEREKEFEAKIEALKELYAR